MSSLQELNVNYEFDFLLFGLVSEAKDYKLAWAVNQALHIHLVKSPDIHIDFNKDHRIVISNFIFKTTHCTFRFLKNKSWTSHPVPDLLLPDQPQVDYLLMIKDDTKTIDAPHIVAALETIPDIVSIISFDVNSLLYKDNLIF